MVRPPLQRTHAVVILHGDPPIPRWVDVLAQATVLTLVVNDPGPGRYLHVPAGARLLVNERPRGFAANVNAAFEVAIREAPEFVLCANFDLALEISVFERLLDALVAHPEAGIAGPVLSDATGAPVFSVGTRPTPVKEFLRAAGLRGARSLRLQRAVLRHTPGWRQRNATDGIRLLAPQEYLPWTAVAIRTSAFAMVGPLDERFELYAEDVDWGVRLAELGGHALLVDVGRVVHAERVTRNPRTSAVYEVSQRRLHEKYGSLQAAAWQSRGLAWRRLPPLRAATEALDWAVIDGRRGLHD